MIAWVALPTTWLTRTPDHVNAASYARSFDRSNNEVTLHRTEATCEEGLAKAGTLQSMGDEWCYRELDCCQHQLTSSTPKTSYNSKPSRPDTGVHDRSREAKRDQIARPRTSAPARGDSRTFYTGGKILSGKVTSSRYRRRRTLESVGRLCTRAVDLHL